MTLDEFIADMKEDLEVFETYWRARNKGNSKHFPMELNSGEWDEQFMIVHDFKWEK